VIIEDSWSLNLQLITLSRALKKYNTATLWNFNHESTHTTFDPIDFMTQYLAIEKP
jgi:hypothetical protein